VHVLDGWARREGPDEDAPEHIADNERLTRKTGHDAAGHGSGEDVGEVAEEEGIR
jgi:hypothetical protein